MKVRTLMNMLEDFGEDREVVVVVPNHLLGLAGNEGIKFDIKHVELHEDADPQNVRIVVVDESL